MTVRPCHISVCKKKRKAKKKLDYFLNPISPHTLENNISPHVYPPTPNTPRRQLLTPHILLSLNLYKYPNVFTIHRTGHRHPFVPISKYLREDVAIIFVFGLVPGFYVPVAPPLSALKPNGHL
jgi:hypothetical protein